MTTMFKAGTALFVYAETSIHLGSGQSLGAVDLAIQRERFTDLPMGASTGLKGIMRDAFEQRYGKEDARVLSAFGPDTDGASDYAGALAFTDLRLLLFPVRSLTGVFAWTTCPLVLERFRRDLRAIGAAVDVPSLPPLKDGQALVSTGSAVVSEQQLVLEEYVLSPTPHLDVLRLGEWLTANALPKTAEYAFWQERLPRHLVVLSDDDFRDFTKHSTEVMARIKLNDRKTTTGDGGNLFYQENLPAESLLYALVLAQDDLSAKLANGEASDLLSFVREVDGHRLQIGGNASTGRGLTHFRFMNPIN